MCFKLQVYRRREIVWNGKSRGFFFLLKNINHFNTRRNYFNRRFGEFGFRTFRKSHVIIDDNVSVRDENEEKPVVPRYSSSILKTNNRFERCLFSVIQYGFFSTLVYNAILQYFPENDGARETAAPGPYYYREKYKKLAINSGLRNVVLLRPLSLPPI